MLRRRMLRRRMLRRIWGQTYFHSQWAARLTGLAMFSAVGAIAMGVVTQPAFAGQACRMYTRPNPGGAYEYEEINNCPPLNGTIQHERWRVQVGLWEPAAFFYRGTERRSGNSIELIDDVVRGTTDRPQYQFKNGNTIYQVTFRPSDSGTLRLEVFQNGRRILNQLLSRTL
ncbi:MAG: hypothetical protein ACFCBU_11805 [Cyanophyceae cyanobacterium]